MPPSLPYTTELALALRAVHGASLLTKSVLRSLNHSVSAETKADSSPVTIADFAAQALLISALHAVFPSDAFLGEESAAQLRADDALAARVWELVQRAAAAQAHDGQDADLALPQSKQQMLDAIDLGATTASARTGRVWVLDPVDGTATFMEGQQYAVCLCLVVDGTQRVAAIGCPNLSVDMSDSDSGSSPRITEDGVDSEGFGVLVSAVVGQGTHMRTMHASSLGPARPVRHDAAERPDGADLAALHFVESTLGKTSLSQDEHRAVAHRLGAQWPGTVLWSQQMKYVALTLGACDVLLRVPKTRERYTYLWDHAGGHLLFTEAGGKVRDFEGGEIDFGQGRRIEGERNFGMVATWPWCFDAVSEAVRGVLADRPR
ncbi:carbohydrate phosphatase [Polyplosphaeria fusca]|uniref:Carbohydrate phosphatase n=1 Tax=Polyplosphaeria fusca TaxID=682080 RepID=A0A9P4R7D8_9PLEO|nr:carbohydrate phosphatase [Polyplosphaeria fusca]